MDNTELIDFWNIHNPKNVVILSGAGVSTNAGIPDYRSLNNNGLRSLLESGKPRHEILSHPSIIEFVNIVMCSNPTESHYLAKVLNDKGILKRVYTQNIDGLYQKVGIPEDKIVEFHGSISKGSTVMYGDNIPDNVLKMVTEDFIVDNDIDMVIVMGTSLQVAPFCALPNLVDKHCPRILIDKNPKYAMTNNFSPKNKTEPDGLYSEPAPLSYIKISGRRVTLRPTWNIKKYLHQLIVESDVDDASRQIIHNLK